MIDALHRAGHRWLKVLFVLALAGSSTLFFIGSAVPKPPGLLIVIIGAVLGIAVEWSYFTVSQDLQEAITEKDPVGIARSLLYTLVGGLASWFLFVNAALHVGWAPTDDLIGLSRVQWAMIAGAMIVLIVFVLSARRKPSKSADLQAIGRAVTILLPDASESERLALLSAIATAASSASSGGKSQVSGAAGALALPPVVTSQSKGGASNGSSQFQP